MVSIPGIAWTRVGDGDFPSEHKEAWGRLRAASTRRRYGKGYAAIIPISNPQIRADLKEMGDYLDSVAGAMWAALSDQDDPEDYRSVRSEAMACELAHKRITAALRTP